MQKYANVITETPELDEAFSKPGWEPLYDPELEAGIRWIPTLRPFLKYVPSPMDFRDPQVLRLLDRERWALYHWLPIHLLRRLPPSVRPSDAEIEGFRLDCLRTRLAHLRAELDFLEDRPERKWTFYDRESKRSHERRKKELREQIRALEAELGIREEKQGFKWFPILAGAFVIALAILV